MESSINVNKIYAYLKENNISKTEFCKRCKISPETFNGLITSTKNTNLKIVFKIAREMKCSLPYLFED